MRACTRCGEVKPLEAFPPVRRGEARLQSWCRECFAAYGREYYRKNRDVQKTRLLRNTAARRADNQGRMIEYLRTHPCVDCGEADIVVLQFDHLANKERDVSSMLSGSWTWPAIQRERSRSAKFAAQIATDSERRCDICYANARANGLSCRRNSC